MEEELKLTEQINVACVHETHLNKQEVKYLKQVFYGIIHYAPVQSHSREVILGKSKQTSFVTKNPRPGGTLYNFERGFKHNEGKFGGCTVYAPIVSRWNSGTKYFQSFVLPTIWYINSWRL